MMIMALCLIAPAMNAELTKKQLKNVEKQAKTKAKELQKEGYTIMGSQSLQAALEKHYSILEEGKASEQPGFGHAKSKNNGRQMCLTFAMAEYATKAASQIKGRTVTDGYGNEIDTENDAEFSRFYAAYERLTQKEISGELQESFTVCKQNPDGSYDFQMYMTVDEERASKARQRAMRLAAEESETAQKYAEQLSEFIKQGF